MKENLPPHSMKDNLSSHSIANEIRMTRSQFKGAFLLVEGQGTDINVYGRVINRDTCQVISAHNKQNVLQTLEILEEAAFVGILAIVDADFWRLDGYTHPSPNLFTTDSHDLETMLLQSPALEKVLGEFGSADKIKTWVEKENSIRQILLMAGRPIGYLRWISLREDYSLDFKDLNYNKFIDKKTIRLNQTKLINIVKSKSNRSDLQTKNLQNLINESEDETHNPWDVCCGHDLVSILSIGLRTAFGTNNTNQVNSESLEKVLRIGYEVTYFYNTTLYQHLKNWEATNTTYQLFPPNQN